ncbi:tape measure protein [Hymenobacter fodinae]|uniref:Tape measure protein N-terminal domain-containing protein n=1 Tax=Hymenobacter fodinae TaxID=2510796 RepID=A0A4Z0P2H6_9BACT|nr:tape measure protein [Hymenobacter fodinae]TGE05554.1 hypothetical protein EU556_19840 [Hymenobacter fodinae]
MATTEELNILLGADTSGLERGLAKGANSVQSFAADAVKAGAVTQGAMQGMGQAAAAAAASMGGVSIAAQRAANGGLSDFDKALNRTVDSAGRLRDSNGRFVSSAKLAAEAAGDLGSATVKASSGFESLASKAAGLQSVGQGLTLGLTVPILGAGAASLKAAGGIESLQNGLKAVVEQTLRTQNPLVSQQQILAETAKQFADLNQVAKLPGLGLKESVQGAINLETIGFSAEKAQQSIKAFGNAVATVGKGREEFGRALNGLQQLANTDFPLGEDLNIIKEAIPQVTPLLKEAFGTARSEELQKLGISSQKVVDTIITGLSQLPPVVGGLNNSFENASDSVTKSAATVGAALNKAFNVEGIINSFSDAITNAAEAFSTLSPPIQKAIFVVAGLAAAVGPVVLAIGAVGAAVPAVVAGLGFLGTAFGAVGTAAGAAWTFILGPVAPIVLAITGLVAAGVLLYKNWDEISDRAAQLGNTLRDKLSAVLEPLGSGLRTVGTAALALGFTSVGTTALAASDGVGTLQGKVSDLQFAVGNTRQEMESLRATFVTISKQTFDPKLNLNPDAFLSLSSVAALTSKPVGKLNGLLDELQKKLKAAQDAQKAATTEEQVEGYNKTIAAIQKQIERLQALGVANSEAAKAYTQVQESLRSVDRLSLSLGKSYDYTAERARALEAGARTLVSAGFAPQSKEVQGLLTQLRALPAAYAEVAASLPKGLSQLKAAVTVEVNPLDDSATQRIQQQLARLGFRVPPLDTTGFTASANELEALAARLTNLPDAGAIDVTQPIQSIAALKNTLSSLTGVQLGAFDISQPLTSLEKVRQELSALTGIAVEDLPGLEGLDITVPIQNIQQLVAAVDTLPSQGVVLDPVSGLDISAPLDSLARLRAALTQAVNGSVPALNTQAFDDSIGRVTQVLTHLPDTIPALSLPPLPALQFEGVGTDVFAQQRNELDRFRTAVSQPFNLGAIDYINFEVSSKVVQDSTSRVVNAVTGMSNYTVERMAVFNEQIEALFDNLAGPVSNALSSIAGSIGEAAGAIVTGGASIGDGLSIVFGGILQALAGFMADFGKQLIAIGIGKLALDTLFKGPAGGPLAIAAGIGLVALAGIASAVAKSSAAKLGGITGSGGASPGALSGGAVAPAPASVKPQELKISVEFAPVTLRQDGPSLRGVLNVDQYRTKRFN